MSIRPLLQRRIRFLIILGVTVLVVAVISLLSSPKSQAVSGSPKDRSAAAIYPIERTMFSNREQSKSSIAFTQIMTSPNYALLCADYSYNWVNPNNTTFFDYPFAPTEGLIASFAEWNIQTVGNGTVSFPDLYQWYKNSAGAACVFANGYDDACSAFFWKDWDIPKSWDLMGGIQHEKDRGGFRFQINGNYVPVKWWGTLCWVYQNSAFPALPDSMAFSKGNSLDCPVTTCNDTQGAAGDPINTRTGGFDRTMMDLSVPTVAGPLTFQRTYASLTTDIYTTTLGYDWTHNHDIRLILPTDPGGISGTVRFKAHTANQYSFNISYSSTYTIYTPFPGVLASLTRIGSNYVLTDSAQAVYTFDAGGKLTTWADSLGHSFTYTYLGGRLDRVTDPSGQRYLAFTYNPQGQLTSVRDHTNRQVSFGYSPAGDLITATDVLSRPWSYTYDAHRLTYISDPDGKTVLRTDYDAQGRAFRQYDGLLDKPITWITYTVAAGTTIFSDGLGRIMAHADDSRNLLVGESDAAGTITTRSYGYNFRPTYRVDGNGNRSYQTWSANGANLTQIVYAPGVSVNQKFDALNNLTQTVDARGFTTTFTYSGTFQTRKTDALGNTWIYTPTSDGRRLLAAEHAPGNRVTSYTYDQFGQRIKMQEAGGNWVWYGYDPLGRLISTTVNAGIPGLARTTLNRYDNAGNPISTTINYTSTTNQPNYLNLYNQTTLYRYDSAGRQTAITDTIGRVTLNFYNNAGRLISTTVNVTTTSTAQNYLGLYNLITRYGYDAVGNRLLVTDTRGLVTKTEYDALNRPVTVTQNYSPSLPLNYLGAYNIRAVTGYDAVGNVLTTTDALGRIVRTWYDNLNRPVTVTQNYSPTLPPGYNGVYNLTTVTTYDAAGNGIASRDPLSRTSTFGYDPLNRLISTTNTLTGTTLYQYDGIGNRIVVTDVLTRATRYEYDKLNRLITTTFPYTGWVVNTYDAAGNRAKTTDALGHSTIYTYDVQGRLVAQSDAMGGAMRFGYDVLGNQVAITDALGVVTRYTYDIAGRKLTAVQNYTATTGLDPDTYNLVTRYRYDVAGNLISTTNSLTATTVYTYDALNRLIAQSNPLGRTWRYEYNALSSRTVITDANLAVTRFNYDGVNRLSAVFYPTDTVRYQYDAVGNRTVMTGSLGVSTFRYDALNRLTGSTDAFNQVVTNTYDAHGNLAGLRYPDGKLVTYTFNANNWLTGVRDWSGKAVTYTYDRVGRVITVALPNNITAGLRYDNANRLAGLTTRNTAWTLAAYTYTLDAAGNRVKAIEYLSDLTSVDYLPLIMNNYSGTVGGGYAPQGRGTTFMSPLPAPKDQLDAPAPFQSPLPTPEANWFGGKSGLASLVQVRPSGRWAPGGLNPTTFLSPMGNPPPCSGGLPTFGSSVVITYTYDPLRRLTGAYYSSGACFLYDYDAGSNVTWAREVITSSRITTYAYNAASQLSTSKVDVESMTWYYAFDNNDNLREMTPNGSTPGNGAIRYSYDAENRLNKVEMHNGSAYAKITEAAYDGEGNRARLVAWVGSTPLTTTYAYQLVEQVQVLQAKTGSNVTTYLYGVNPIGEFGSQSVYYLADGAGSIRQLANPSGFVVLSRWYEPFGQVLTQKGTAVATHGYLGVQLDRVTGLVYINGRYYDPVTGRFLTPNGGQNPYMPLPISASLLGPLMVLSAAAQRNRRRRKWAQMLAVVLVVLAASGMLVSCTEPRPQPPPPDDQQPTPTQPPGRTPGRQTPSPVPTTPMPSRTPTPTPTCTPTSTSTPIPGNLPRRYFIAEDHSKPDNPKVKSEKDIGFTCSPTALFILLRYWGAESDLNKVIAAVDEIPPEQGGLDHAYKESRCPTNPVCTSLQVIAKVAKDYTSRSGLKVDVREGWTKEEIMGYIVRDIPVMVNYGGGGRGQIGHSLVVYGYDLDAGSEGTIWFANPGTGSTLVMEWKHFYPMWTQSDWGDPLRRGQNGEYETYKKWALALYK